MRIDTRGECVFPRTYTPRAPPPIWPSARDVFPASRLGDSARRIPSATLWIMQWLKTRGGGVAKAVNPTPTLPLVSRLAGRYFKPIPVRRYDDAKFVARSTNSGHRKRGFYRGFKRILLFSQNSGTYQKFSDIRETKLFSRSKLFRISITT